MKPKTRTLRAEWVRKKKPIHIQDVFFFIISSPDRCVSTASETGSHWSCSSTHLSKDVHVLRVGDHGFKHSDLTLIETIISLFEDFVSSKLSQDVDQPECSRVLGLAGSGPVLVATSIQFCGLVWPHQLTCSKATQRKTGTWVRVRIRQQQQIDFSDSLGWCLFPFFS